MVIGNAAALYIPDGNKNIITWTYAFMLAGDKQPDGYKVFEELSLPDLIKLYSHCALLQYRSLMIKCIARIRYKLHKITPDAPSIRNIYSFIPELKGLAAEAIARQFVRPWVLDYAPYLELAEHDSDFDLDLTYTIQDMLKERVAAGRKYYNRPANREVRQSSQYYGQPNSSSGTLVTSPIRTANKKARFDKVSKPGPSLRVETSNAKVREQVKNSRRPNNAKRGQATEGPEAGTVQSGAVTGSEKEILGDDIKTAHPKRKARPSRKTSKLPKPTAAERVHRIVPPRAEANKANTTCYKCGLNGHFARECTTIVETDPPCRKCGIKGHVARQCTTATTEQDHERSSKSEGPKRAGASSKTDSIVEAIKEVVKTSLPARPPPTCYNCNAVGHIARNCTILRMHRDATSSSPPRKPLVCYNCNSIGHIARNCTIPDAQTGPSIVKAVNAELPSPPKSKAVLQDVSNTRALHSGRNRNYRRAKEEKSVEPIVLTGNGEGLRTCDREVRRGEVTRLGLVI